MSHSVPTSDSIVAEIDLGAISENTRILKRHAGSAALMAVVKANAYGHGAVPVARKSLESGATWLGVARLSEAVELREAGIDAPILILGVTPEWGVPTLIKHGIRQAVVDEGHAKVLSAAACEAGGTLLCHMKVDTGMGRLGFDASSPEVCARKVRACCQLPGLSPEGIFTHFATADEADLSFARHQVDLFKTTLDHLEALGQSFSMRHGANSASIFTLPELALDMVRGGICLYGLSPSADVSARAYGLKPAMAIRSRVVQVKRVGKGQSVSYGATWMANEDRVIATVACGYGDGYPRKLSNVGSMVVRGHRVPVVGRVCMDMTMVDVTGVDGVRPGDDVMVMGTLEGEEVTAEEIAGHCGTINYEITCLVTPRVLRVYS